VCYIYQSSENFRFWKILNLSWLGLLKLYLLNPGISESLSEQSNQLSLPLHPLNDLDDWHPESHD
jgi:hypothetical protein